MTGRRQYRVYNQGYVRVWLPEHPLAAKDGYVMEHRLVLHEAGIEVPLDRYVHHKNHNKSDNRVENLEVLTAQEHTAKHAQEDGQIVNQYGVWSIEGTKQRRLAQQRIDKARRFAKLREDPSIRPHGLINTAKHWGCTCQLCLDAVNAYKRALRKAKSA